MKRIILAVLTLFVLMFSVSCEQGSSYTRISTTLESAIADSVTVNGTQNAEPSNVHEGLPMSNGIEVDAEEPANGGALDSVCTVHMPQAHRFSISLINYVGQEVFMEWIEDVELLNVEAECRKPSRTIYEFIKHFDIPKSVFEEIYYSGCYTTRYYDVELFYSGDDDAVEAFLRDKDTAEKILDKRLAFDELKHGIYSTFEKQFKEKYGEVSYNQVTLADMVRELNVPRELLEDYASKTTTGRSYDYNFDLLYLDQGNNLQLSTEEFAEFERFNNMMLEASKDSYPVRAADAIICGVDDYRTE